MSTTEGDPRDRLNYGDKRLAGKTLVVVGAGAQSPGGWSNGKACSVVYAREGAFVVCVDYHLDRAEETADCIASEGGKAIALRADATNEADMRAVVARTLADAGRIDVIHNNVGVGRAIGLPDKVPLEEWDFEIAQDVTSAYMGIRVAAPIMREQGGGAIINTSSLFANRFINRPTTAYTVGKAGVEALTRSCAAFYGPDNIRVNCIRIGFSETPASLQYLEGRSLTEAQRQAELDKTRRKVPLRREHGTPFDVAHACAFLASDLASHITGVILSVDGGLDCAPI